MAPGTQLHSQKLHTTNRSKQHKPFTEKSPLLPLSKSKSGHQEFYDGYTGASFSSAVFSLTTSVVGAGIMGLPAAVKTLGLIPGILTIIFVGLLADTGVEMMLKFSSVGKVVSYAGLMADSFGRPGRILLQASVLLNNMGILIAYLIIIGDVLSGSTSSGVHHSGVLEEWAGESTWWNSRLAVLLFSTVFILAPLVSFRRVDSLRLSSALSVALAVMFVIVMAVITVTKIIVGHLNTPRLFPNISGEASVLELFEVIPIVVTAYICHQSVHPVLNELHDASQAKGVVRTSLALCIGIYITMSVFGYLLFGESTMEDVLSNFDADLGVRYGGIMCDIVRIGYALHLLLVFPLLHFTLRLNLDGLLFPAAAVSLSFDTCRFALLTVTIVIAIFLGAYFIPNINVAFQFTGATSAVCLGFIFPGIVCLRDVHDVSTKKERFISWVMVILALGSSTIAISGDIITLFGSNTSSSSGPSS